MQKRLSRLLRVSSRPYRPLVGPRYHVRVVAMAAEWENKKEECEELPKLSSQEFRQYNRLSEHMDYFV